MTFVKERPNLFFNPSSEPYDLKAATMEHFSQWSQDKILAPILNQVKDGFFVESGALDGETASNTLYYEKHGWSGLLIEPSPNSFTELVKKHRKAFSYRGALSPTWKSENLHFVNSAGDALDKVLPEDQIGIDVEAQPLTELMRRANRSTIDFWSLDIEGCEGVVLQHTDFKKIEIGVILIEMNRKGENNDTVDSVMREQGFVDVGRTKYCFDMECEQIEWLDHIFVNPRYFEKRGMKYPRGLEWDGWQSTWDWGEQGAP